MSITLTVCGHFDAAHRMPGHPSISRRRLHGHTYHVRVTLENSGGEWDADAERARLSSVLLELDHRQLAQSREDAIDEDAVILLEPITMEALARYIAARYQQGPASGAVRRVRVSSQPDAYAEVTL